MSLAGAPNCTRCPEGMAAIGIPSCVSPDYYTPGAEAAAGAEAGVGAGWGALAEAGSLESLLPPAGGFVVVDTGGVALQSDKPAYVIADIYVVRHLADLRVPPPAAELDDDGFPPGAGAGSGRAPALPLPARVHLHGQASLLTFPKNSLTVKMLSGAGKDAAGAFPLPRTPGGAEALPAGTHWVLNAPYGDQSLVRNVLAYNLRWDRCRQRHSHPCGHTCALVPPPPAPPVDARTHPGSNSQQLSRVGRA
jgi:hypothetical protein